MEAITILWLSFSLLGQWSLFIVLSALFCVKSLPQRNNPFLVNLLLTTYLSTFPQCLLFFTGQQENPYPAHWICNIQFILMNATAPMFTMALVVLAAHTWCDIRSKLSGITPITTRHGCSKFLFLLLPYATLLAWCIASLVVGLQNPSGLHHLEYAYCYNSSASGVQLRRIINFFLLGIGLVGFFFKACAVRLIWLNHTRSMRDASLETYFVSLNIGLRILAFCITQVVMIILIMINSFPEHLSPHVKDALQIMQSMYAFSTFLIFGTQADIWHALTFWRWRARPDVEATAKQELVKPHHSIANIV